MSARVLVVEDNSTSMELMLYLLKNMGFTAIFAFDAEDGFRLAVSTAPDLILCDVELPGMSGVALMRKLKLVDGLSGVPIVAVTAMTMTGDQQGLIALGFDGYIGKPIEPEQLEQQLRRYLVC